MQNFILRSGFVLYDSGLKPLNMIIFWPCVQIFTSVGILHTSSISALKKMHGGKTSLCKCCGESYKMTLMQNLVSGTAWFFLPWFCEVILGDCKFETDG